MKIFKNKGIKNLILTSTLIIVLAIISVVCINGYYNNKYKQTINLYISNILNVVVKEYPNVSEEDLVKILNSKKLEEESSLLEKYGIYNEPAIEILKQKDKNIIMYNLIILIATSVALTVVFYFYF